MACDPELLKHVPVFELLDDDELAVLAAQVEPKNYSARERIYKMGEPGAKAYVVASGKVRVTIVDDDHQEVVVAEPVAGEFFGFASMLDQTPHETAAIALEQSLCIEIEREDIAVLLQKKPHAGMDLLAVLGRHFHASQKLVRVRAMRNPNEVIEDKMTFGDRLSDGVARFGGSWFFISLFSIVLVVYTTINVGLGGKAWDPYPFILLNLFLSMIAAVQAPIIMMSQNRQDTKDRVRGELDFDVNKRAEAEIQTLSRKLNLLGEQMGDIEDLLREKVSGQAAPTARAAHLPPSSVS
jgi:CRP/FNR family cyclic AMP-dependent transcriptional regulator